mmetsp:Transcript_7282/g.25831  ORF Transcript_7282/g.25831 Transcript_7282/m.25831 type:complete len:88 (-) Transcript_7282:1446-1709(-)
MLILSQTHSASLSSPEHPLLTVRVSMRFRKHLFSEETAVSVQSQVELGPKAERKRMLESNNVSEGHLQVTWRNMLPRCPECSSWPVP